MFLSEEIGKFLIDESEGTGLNDRGMPDYSRVA
jgi:hypothetical protein